MLPVWPVLALASGFASLIAAAGWDFQDDSDLHTFVSRPDIRAPRFNVSVYNERDLTPGYWFTAPYADLNTRVPSTTYKTGQTGPHIYDSRGELVWSGAYLFGERATFDFKVAEFNGSQYLTFIVGEDLRSSLAGAGAGMMLDNSYNIVKSIRETAGRGTPNMHELLVVDRGTRALWVTYESKLTPVSKPSDTTLVNGWVGNNGFTDVDVATDRPVFEWWALDHIHPSESVVRRPSFPGAYSAPWDFFHLNSVDKNADGDYLISARFTNCIYKISGKDGSIIWRLGGPRSTFKMQGFNFSSQHDARFRVENSTTTIISLFDNHSNGQIRTADTSSALMVAIDMKTSIATMYREWLRPDGRLSHLRGNAQLLPNDNMFVCWSENSYISEYNNKDRLVFEAQFASHRFRTYRAFKFNFTAVPSEPIALKAYVYGADPETSTTAFYVSWNGATQVQTWRFWGFPSPDGEPKYLGSSPPTGFETVFMTSGVIAKVFAEALDSDSSLGNSSTVTTILPTAWNGHNGNIVDKVWHAIPAPHGAAIEPPSAGGNTQGPSTTTSADYAVKSPDYITPTTQDWPSYSPFSPPSNSKKPSKKNRPLDPLPTINPANLDWNYGTGSNLLLAVAGIMAIILCWIVWSGVKRIGTWRKRLKAGDYTYQVVVED